MARSPRPKTAFEKTIPDYRTRILVALFRAVILPPLVTLFALRALGTPFDEYSVLLAVFSVPASVIARSWYSTWRHSQVAVSLGAQVIPRVQGKWPGNLDIVIKIVRSFEEEYVLQGFADLFQEYNCTTLNTRFFWEDQFISMDENVMQFVLSTSFARFEKGVLWHERIDKLLGTGLINAERESWKKGRQLARPFFAKERISDFEIFERTASTTLDCIETRARNGEPIDIQDLMSRFTLDSASQFLFGIKLDTLSRPLSEPGKVKLGPKGSVRIDTTDEFDIFTEAFERVAVIITRRGSLGDTWPLLELFHDKTEASIDIIMRWMDPLAQHALEGKAKIKSSGDAVSVNESVFLQYLASQTDDLEHIRYELITYLIASRDTTASLLMFVLYFFAVHPHVCDKLRQEIMDVVGPNEPPTYQQLKGMKYLCAVINETLRLFPSAPLIPRNSLVTPLVVPTQKAPLYFPPRTQVMLASLLLHRRHDLWGDTADDFIPERWFDEKVTESVGSKPFMYCPFSGGPRVCIGQEFALNEASYFLTRLLQRFKGFKLAPSTSLLVLYLMLVGRESQVDNP
ncbi:cytochrome P450 monooxygenase CYP63 [Cyathus striatus]|nr:cytochrome P450 monooxygenase CYP63 [Cyathus striatus]